MSAYLCESSHSSACAEIVLSLVHERYTKCPFLEEVKDLAAGDLFTLFLNENLKSVHGRYPDNTEAWDHESLFMIYREQGVKPGDYERYPRQLTVLAQALKALDCLEYQCCEHDTWPETLAFKLLDWASSILAQRIAANTPQYDKSEWGWNPQYVAVGR